MVYKYKYDYTPTNLTIFNKEIEYMQKKWPDIIDNAPYRGSKKYLYCLCRWSDWFCGCYSQTCVQTAVASSRGTGSMRYIIHIVHMVRNSLSYVSYKHSKQVATDLKTIYTAATAAADQNLDAFTEKNGTICPRQGRSVIKSFQQAIRAMLNTTVRIPI